MANPRDVDIDIVGHDKTERATSSAERNLDSLERKIAKLEDRTRKAGFASDQLAKKWAKHNDEAGKFGDKIEKVSGILLKVAAGGGAAAAGLGALQPVIIGITTALAPAAAALGAFGGVLGSVYGGVAEASQKNQDLLDKIRLQREKAKVFLQRGDSESADKALKKAADAAVELRARYNLLDPAVKQAVISMDHLKMTWQEFVDKNTPRVVESLTRAFEFLIRTIPKLQPLFNAGADAVERFLGFIERKEKDGTIDRFITWLTVNAGPAFDQITDAIDGTWHALQVAWRWWGDLSTAVYAAVQTVRVYVLNMRLNWYTTLAQMYSDSASFLTKAAEAFGKLPGIGEKTKRALLQAAAGLDVAAKEAAQKAADIQNSINSIHGRDIPVNIYYKVHGAPNGSLVPDWYGQQSTGETGYRKLKYATGDDVMPSAGGGRAAPPAPISVAAPNVNVSVTIPGLAQAIRAMVRTEVDQAMAVQAFRARSGRAYG